jgi:hypothetical protein
VLDKYRRFSRYRQVADRRRSGQTGDRGDAVAEPERDDDVQLTATIALDADIARGAGERYLVEEREIVQCEDLEAPPLASNGDE